MPVRRMLALSLGVVMTVTACASSGTGSTRSSGSRNVLTREQIVDVSVNNALEAVERLRPSWLRTRGVTSSSGNSPIMVYMDGIRLGDIRTLQQVRVERIIEMRFINARDATTRWGTGHTNGAIEVTTR